MFNHYLIQHTKEKEQFSIKALKKMFPKKHKEIARLKFLGLIEPVDFEKPDIVIAHIYTEYV